MFSRLANPRRFFQIWQYLLPFSAVLMLVLWPLGLYWALMVSPIDYQQGETVRILYIHVPAAWLSMALYAGMALAALWGYVWRHQMAFLFCRAAAPVGASMALICLVTGSLWGQPMWGTWWVWDARLTSMLILFFLYLGAMALSNAFQDPARGDKASALLLMVGAVNLPIIKFSVDWWHTLHQPASLLRAGGPALHPEMLQPLLIMAAAYLAMTIWLVLLRLRTLYLRARQAQRQDNGYA